MKSNPRASFIIAFAATLVRYYDYALFGLSASVISETFMPGHSSSDQLLGFFALFSLAVIAKPVGSIIFGKIGDKIGRVESVKAATALAALSTSLIALIPGYNVFGTMSVILLTFCRMIFLMSFAGEVDAIRIYIAEKTGKNYRYLANGLVSFSAQMGVLIAAGMYRFSMSIEEALNLWRVNFLLGGSFGLIIILLRNSLKESDVFIKTKSELIVDSSVLSIIKAHRIKFILSTLINGALGGVYHFLIIFLSTFAAKVAGVITEEAAELHNIELIATYSIACAISGFVADKTRHIIKQINIALILSALCIFIMQLFILKGVFLVSLHFLLVFCAPFYIIPTQIKLQSIFHASVRMRMCSLSHSLGSMIFSSTSPFVCMLLWKYTEMLFVIISFYVFLLGIMFFCISYIAKKKYSNMFEA